MNILILDRAPLTYPRIRQQLGKSKEGVFVHETGSCSEALTELGKMRYDLVILDSRLPDRVHLQMKKEVKIKCPGAKLLRFNGNRTNTLTETND